ncbi:hypothetical protein SAFG77S_12327 [Streptomyces afghaniensis]
MVEKFHAGGVDADVVGGPELPEVLATGGQFTDQVHQPTVVEIAAGLGAQHGDRVAGDLVPLPEELGGLRVEEDEPGVVGRPRRVGVDGGEEGAPEVVVGQDVPAPAEDEGGCAWPLSTADR